MSRHGASRRRHPVAITVGVIAAIVVLLAVAAAGVKLAKQAEEVKEHESQAIGLIQPYKNAASVTDVEGLLSVLPQVQQQTQEADSIAHGTLWNIAARLPFVGGGVSAAQSMTSIANDFSTQAVPQLATSLARLSAANLNGGAETINLHPLTAAEPQIAAANAAVQKDNAAYQALRSKGLNNIPQLEDAYTKGAAELSRISQLSQSVADMTKILPAFLGRNGTKTYLLVSASPAESRSSAGLIGDVGKITITDGRIAIDGFVPNSALIPYGSANDTAAAKALFAGPLHPDFDIRDQMMDPDYAQAAAGVTEIWQRSPYRCEVDGVITVTPAFLQAVNQLGSPFTLSNGQTISGSNTAQYLENTVYLQDSSNKTLTDALEIEVARDSIQNLFTGMDVSKLFRFAEALPALAQDRDIQATSSDPSVQTLLTEDDFTQAPQSNAVDPTVGAYDNEQLASKMGWYLHRSATVTRTSCNQNGSQTYHVAYTLKNVLTTAEASGLNTYIDGQGWGLAKAAPGDSVDRMVFYAPKGGEIFNMSVTGDASTPAKYQYNGTAWSDVATTAPGQSTVYSFDVTTSPQAKTALRLDQTPNSDGVSGITYSTRACALPSQN